MTNRNVSRKMREINKTVSISTLCSFILSLGGFIIAFLSAFPNSSLNSIHIINPYFIMNVFLAIIITIVILYIIYISIWFYVKNAPPLVEIKEYISQDTACIRLKNNEPVDLDYVQIKMGGLALDNLPNGWAVLEDNNNLLKIEGKIVNGEKKKIEIANGTKGYTHFSIDDGLIKFPLHNIKENEAYRTYRIAFEVFAHPVDEQKPMLVGRYFGIIYHRRVNGKEFSDKPGYQNVVGWKKDSFKEISEKEYHAFVTVSPVAK